VIYGYIGKTPCRIDSDARSAWIAVETILPPDAPTGDPLVGDGESERYYYSGDGKRHFMKIYWLRKIEDETVAKQFALMYLKTATEKELEEAIPKEEMFRIKQPENALAALTNDGLSDMAANRIMRLALRAGKVLYKATNGQDKAFEITSADGEFDVKTVEQR
jgi:hypothetical protein